MAALVDEIAASVAMDGVRSALAAARGGVDALLRDRGLRHPTAELVAESLLRGAGASAVLEGSASDLEQLRRGQGDALARSAARLNAELLALVPVVTRSPLQALARMHTLAAADHVAHVDNLGRPRDVEGVAGRLRSLSACLQATTELPGAAVAAVAHAEIATLRPFDSCNGLVARALERLLIVARGVDPASMLVPEAGHLALVAGYRSALAAYALGDLAGRRAWLLHSTHALSHAAELSPLRHHPPPCG